MKRIYLSLSLLLLVIIGSRAANFKFAFLTDIHITAGDSIPYNDLARSVNQINDTDRKSTRLNSSHSSQSRMPSSA